MARLAGAAASSCCSKQAAAQGTRAHNCPAVFMYRISVSYHVTCNAIMRNATCVVMMTFLCSIPPTHNARQTYHTRQRHTLSTTPSISEDEDDKALAAKKDGKKDDDDDEEDSEDESSNKKAGRRDRRSRERRRRS